MTSPCLEQLARKRQRDPVAVDEAIKRISAIHPLLLCKRSDATARAMVISAADLLARIFPVVFLDISSAELRKVAVEAIQAVNPAAVGSKAPTSPRILSIGASAANAVSIDASGWRVCAASSNQDLEDLPKSVAPIGPVALLAAILGVARILTTAGDIVKAKAPNKPTRINLWSPDPSANGSAVPPEIAFNVHAFGHGSIGHAAWESLLLNHTLRGTLTAVDPDGYEPHNPARYAFLKLEDLNRTKVKALELRSQSTFTITGLDATVQQWQKANDIRPRLALICPDNLEARAWAADTFPQIAVSASANEREARVAICDPSRGICAYCTFAPDSASLMSQRDAIQAFTGLHMALVNQYTVEWDGRSSPPMDQPMVATIEATRGVPPGSYSHWIGKRLLEFIEANRHELYSAAVLKSKGAERLSLPVPLAGAASGALAAASMIRVAIDDFDEAQTGFNEYQLDVFSGELSFIRNRRPDSQTCLCQHPARIKARESDT
jgi:hypothetical protein